MLFRVAVVYNTVVTYMVDQEIIFKQQKRETEREADSEFTHRPLSLLCSIYHLSQKHPSHAILQNNPLVQVTKQHFAVRHWRRIRRLLGEADRGIITHARLDFEDHDEEGAIRPLPLIDLVHISQHGLHLCRTRGRKVVVAHDTDVLRNKAQLGPQLRACSLADADDEELFFCVADVRTELEGTYAALAERRSVLAGKSPEGFELSVEHGKLWELLPPRVESTFGLMHWPCSPLALFTL